MLTKTLLTLSLLLVAGCKASFPTWPEAVQSHFFVAFDQAGEVHCYAYKIVSQYPYRIAEKMELTPLACDGLGGYLPHEMKDIMNYSGDVKAWVDKECK